MSHRYIIKIYSSLSDLTSLLYAEAPSERQRDLHIKVHLKASPPNTIPHDALSILHSYEMRAIPAPMKSYTRLITALFSAQSSLGYAQAWDLFAHMRYIAHPNPDALLYTLMIRACASSLNFSSEPERALDLWTEMTVDHGIQPTAGAYTAVILACARSGSKMYIHEAFRLAKEMLDSHRDATGHSAFKPDGRIFSALLEGAKRVGDLARTRWILAEMVRGAERDEESRFVDAAVSEEVMMHVFHAYAAYKPPFKRAAVLVDEKEPAQTSKSMTGSNTSASMVSSSSSSSDDEAQEFPLTETTIPSFSHLPPQSRSEIIGEVQTLFARIVEDTTLDGSEARLFSNVKLTPRLLNSYLSVHYAFASILDSQELFETIFEELNVPRNVRSYIEALERCSSSKRGQERAAAFAFAEKLWPAWQDLENGQQNGVTGTVTARMIERANFAMIRMWTL